MGESRTRVASDHNAVPISKEGYSTFQRDRRLSTPPDTGPPSPRPAIPCALLPRDCNLLTPSCPPPLNATRAPIRSLPLPPRKHHDPVLPPQSPHSPQRTHPKPPRRPRRRKRRSPRRAERQRRPPRGTVRLEVHMTKTDRQCSVSAAINTGGISAPIMYALYPIDFTNARPKQSILRRARGSNSL